MNEYLDFKVIPNSCLVSEVSGTLLHGGLFLLMITK